MTLLFNPYTGLPRHPSDIASDPNGLLIVDIVESWAPLKAAAKTNAERQREFRARQAEQQATEVRGIFAHLDDKPAIKALAEKLARKRAKARVIPTQIKSNK